MPIYPLNEPARGSNNSWYRAQPSDKVIVFVHGVLSDSGTCWYREPSGESTGVYWPDLLQNDPRFNGSSIYLGGYESSVDSGPYEIRNCAQELVDALQRPGEKGEGAVLDRRAILFVCHSLGGVVVRYMLTARPGIFRDKVIGLALIASPSYGSDWADRLDLFVKYFKNEQGKILRWGSEMLQDLDSRFKWLLQDKEFPNLSGKAACEHHFIVRNKWTPPLEPLVSEVSAGRYFGPAVMLRDTDHFTCVKPYGHDHPGYQFLFDFYRGFGQGGPTAPTTMGTSSTQAGKAAAAPAVKATPVCRRLHWDLTIDEEGDAYNEMVYEGIVLPTGGPAIFELPPAEVQTGHTSHFELARDSRTSEGVTLQSTESADNRKILTTVLFSNCPSQTRPANFCVWGWDWNAYSMNMEEYTQKPGWNADGLDYAEKSVPENWDAFSLLIRFPKQMVFAKRPFLEVYDYSSGKDQRSDEITEKYQDCFYYSIALNQAVLYVARPQWPLSYRISWLLGEGQSEENAAALLPRQRVRQRAFAQKLLEMRRSFDAPTQDSEMQHLSSAVNTALASLPEYIHQEMNLGVPLDPQAIELSLMVLDEDQPEKSSQENRAHPVLRIVAGTSLRDPVRSKLRLFVGDGNAGRAWKRRTVRVFDRSQKDPKRHIYLSLPGVPQHSLLISVPLLDRDSAALVYGILNIGTFSDTYAEVLRPLGEPDKIGRIMTYVQGFVLQRLLEVIRL